MDYSKYITDEQALLSFQEIERIVPSDIPATIISNSCYVGGWAILPRVNMTALTAAGPESPQSEAWMKSASIGRSCGSIFASTLIASLSKSTSPLIDGSSPAGAPTLSIQPENANPLQTATFNEFCATIKTTLREQITRRPEDHDFRFSAQDDDWAKCWMARTGVPLTKFETRWNSLPVYKATQKGLGNVDPNYNYEPDLEKAITAMKASLINDELPIPSPTFSHLGTRGRAAGGEAWRQSLRMIALKLANSCPGDECSGRNVLYTTLFQEFAHGRSTAPLNDEIIIDVILYRDQVAMYIDTIVKSYGLQKSQGKYLLDWDRHYWLDLRRRKDECWISISMAASADGLYWPDNDHRSSAFSRCNEYLIECIYLSSVSVEDAVGLVHHIAHNYHQDQKEVQDEVTRQRSVRYQAGKWLKTLGRSIRALSPGKRAARVPLDAGRSD